MTSVAKDKKEYIFSGVVMRQILTGDDTDRKFCLFENRSGGNSGSPVHVHADEDETIHVLEGEMQAIIAGVIYTVAAGSGIFMPKGVPHQLKNTSGHRSTYLILCTPSGFEEFVATAGRVKGPEDVPGAPTPQEIAKMKASAPHFGITLLPGFEAQK